MPDSTLQLILASQSPYRLELLRRLRLDPVALPADIDESPTPAEEPAKLATRLAAGKARKIATLHPDALVIGADQVAALGATPLGKPGGRARAIEQLEACSGQTVIFYTAVTVLRLSNGFAEQHTDLTRVQFRKLTSAEIAAYVDADEPYDCAGSFRSEGLGAALFESIENRDPAAIIGLPLIWLAGALGRGGVALL